MGNRAGMYGFIESVRDRPLLAISVYHRTGGSKKVQPAKDLSRGKTQKRMHI